MPISPKMRGRSYPRCAVMLPTARDWAAIGWERPGHRRHRAPILPSLFPWQLLLCAFWLTGGTVVQFPRQCIHSLAPQVLNQLICRCRRSQHTSGWRHDSPYRRGAFPSASELVVMFVRAWRPAGCGACIGPCRLSCSTIRARLALPPPPRLFARFPITKRPHPVPEEAFLCLRRPLECLRALGRQCPPRPLLLGLRWRPRQDNAPDIAAASSVPPRRTKA